MILVWTDHSCLPSHTPLDKATYNCSCENTGSVRYTPIVGSVWPYALLIVIVMLRHMGNYFLLNLKGSDRSSDGDIGILGMNTLSRASVLLTIFASIICLSIALTTKRVPLHKPLHGSKLRRRIREQLILILSSCGGRPLGGLN
jgi:hypothetical protein